MLYEVPSIGNNPWAGLGRILRNHRKTLMSSVHLCPFLWEGFPRQTCVHQVGKTSLLHKGCVSVHSCQTAILPHLGTLNSAYWALHFSISIHLRIFFSCSMRFFQLKITLELVLGESWLLLAQRRKNTDVYKGLIPWEGFPRQTCIHHLRDTKSWSKFRLYNNSFAPARSLCHGN